MKKLILPISIGIVVVSLITGYFVIPDIVVQSRFDKVFSRDILNKISFEDIYNNLERLYEHGYKASPPGSTDYATKYVGRADLNIQKRGDEFQNDMDISEIYDLSTWKQVLFPEPAMIAITTKDLYIYVFLNNDKDEMELVRKELEAIIEITKCE